MTLLVRPPAQAAPTPRARRAVPVVLGSAAAGVLLAVLWSFDLVDGVIGKTVADTLLGHDAKADAIGGTVAGLVFAFVSGLAGTFTACNIAMAASVGPMSQVSRTGRGSAGLRAVVRPVCWLAVGMLAVSATYGFVGVLVGDQLPQLSSASAAGIPLRLWQAMVVFGVIGLVFTAVGAASLGLLPDPFAQRRVARVVTLGALVGGFLVGRPFPLFGKLFRWAVDTGNPLYGAGAFALQSLGNIAVVSVLFTLVVLVTRGRVIDWLTVDPVRGMTLSGSLLVTLGVFTVVYWDIRLPAMFGHGWFPVMPYNG
ncbi:hypothetical protein JQN72_11180 [Phycicoccus sp. CSK15P-2]|uniref:hypothetical protein n=1 Tax=Phycicoccus sp. CSK15P-2 TaxID=2807627 RepID=UPI00194DF2E1|nr:hypothetical protein [Phycicoccus sp. CSK15P-2]MBM6404806.1 hypothetical protein [Phycicoccus sp. CSK15P-2]